MTETDRLCRYCGRPRIAGMPARSQRCSRSCPALTVCENGWLDDDEGLPANRGPIIGPLKPRPNRGEAIRITDAVRRDHSDYMRCRRYGVPVPETVLLGQRIYVRIRRWHSAGLLPDEAIRSDGYLPRRMVFAVDPHAARAVLKALGLDASTLPDTDALELHALIMEQEADAKTIQVQHGASLDRPSWTEQPYGELTDGRGFHGLEWRDPTFDNFMLAEERRESERERELECENGGHGYRGRTAVAWESEIMDADQAGLRRMVRRSRR